MAQLKLDKGQVEECVNRILDAIAVKKGGQTAYRAVVNRAIALEITHEKLGKDNEFLKARERGLAASLDAVHKECSKLRASRNGLYYSMKEAASLIEDLCGAVVTIEGLETDEELQSLLVRAHRVLVNLRPRVGNEK